MTIHSEISKLQSKTRAKVLQRFFKTGPGEYAEGDVFLGLTVGQSRAIAKQFKELSLLELTPLLSSPIHEERLISLIILSQRYRKADENEQKKIFAFLIKNRKGINNWDLVDTIAPAVFGPHLFDKDRSILYKYAKSKNLWERRIAIISTFYFLRQQDFRDTLQIAEALLNDEHDLIHKAAGWMLREVGKRDVKTLKSFLNKNAGRMPRTMLRYAIEKFPEQHRQRYLKIKRK
ncbi:DNA alkylation repair protein [Bdellovibrio sp. HCB288]|uniref:DNA alkylation repair protein n=1 Tax=Bdellovibrio sp. HCB288 TaxID=3394355 RepID=UPI0039B43648